MPKPLSLCDKVQSINQSINQSLPLSLSHTHTLSLSLSDTHTHNQTGTNRNKGKQPDHERRSPSRWLDAQHKKNTEGLIIIKKIRKKKKTQTTNVTYISVANNTHNHPLKLQFSAFQASDIAQPKKDKWVSFLSHFSPFFHRLIVVKVSFCSLIKGITPKIGMLCFVLINSVILNLLCVWIYNFRRKRLCWKLSESPYH